MTAKQRIAWRSVDGILLLDKPIGLSSNQALQRARRAYRARKAGHTGSLDPFASGMLPLCFGQATKVSAMLLDSSKRYRVEARLGVRTTTGDPEGEIVERQDVPGLDRAAWEPLLDRFRGDIQQVPPMYSALKHQGRRLYELAREGKEVERPPRDVTIHELTLEALSEDVVELSVHCSKGTYIRSLVEDIAEALGTVAHTTDLRRTAVGPFQDADMVTLEELEAAESLPPLLPVDAALMDLPAVDLTEQDASRLINGQVVDVSVSETARVRVYGPERRFLGIGELEPGQGLRPRRLMATQETSGNGSSD